MKFSLAVLALVFMLLFSTVISYEFEDYTALSHEFSLRDDTTTLAHKLSEENDEEDTAVFSENFTMETSKPLDFEVLEKEHALQTKSEERPSSSTVQNTITQSKKVLAQESSEDILSYHSETPLVLTS